MKGTHSSRYSTELRTTPLFFLCFFCVFFFVFLFFFNKKTKSKKKQKKKTKKQKQKKQTTTTTATNNVVIVQLKDVCWSHLCITTEVYKSLLCRVYHLLTKIKQKNQYVIDLVFAVQTITLRYPKNALLAWALMGK